jgi:hypothetical protein
MLFPSGGTGKPFIRIDGRNGSFLLSVPDGGDPEIVEMKGRLLDLDLASAAQGWLKISKDGPDWSPLETIDDWAGTPRPSADHAPGVCIDLMCSDWSEPQVRQLRGSSRAITGFVTRVAEAAGTVPDGKAVRVRITGANVKKFGMGSSADLAFEIAPKEKWPAAATFDEHRDAPEPTTAPATSTTDGASAAFSSMKDSPLDGPAKAAADAWA